MTPKFLLSRDSQALYITVVAKDRLAVFRSDAIKLVTCKALDEARKSGGFLIFAYVDHARPSTSVNRLPENLRADLVDRAIDYRWSGARIWQRIPDDDEPLMVDLNRIEWRRA